ncbi:MAG: 50S ribosomal protein L10 [bacterium]
MNKEEKIALVKELKEKCDSAQSLILADFKGISVEKVNELRGLMRDQNVEYRVIKNNLLKRVLKEVSGIEEYLTGATAVAIGYDDPTVPARILADFIKDNPDNIKIKAGLVGAQLYNQKMVEALAKLPGREELLAKLLGLLQAPVTGLASVLQAPVRDLAVVLSCIATQKESNS